MNEPNTSNEEYLDYSLSWQEGHGLRSDPPGLHIKAVGDDAAFERLASAMGITLKNGRPTLEDFNKAGGKEFFCGNLQIFPPLPDPSCRRIISLTLG